MDANQSTTRGTWFYLRAVAVVAIVVVAVWVWWTKPQLFRSTNAEGKFTIHYNYKQDGPDGEQVLHGSWALSSANKTKLIAGNYADGTRQGWWTASDHIGNKLTEGKYDSGARQGEWNSWYSNHQKHQQWNYVTGDAVEKYSSWWKNGNIKIDGWHEEGKRAGHWSFYSEKGKLIAEGNYQADLPDGDWSYYDNRGKKSSHRKFLAGYPRVNENTVDRLLTYLTEKKKQSYRCDPAQTIACLGPMAIAPLAKSLTQKNQTLQKQQLAIQAIEYLANSPVWSVADNPLHLLKETAGQLSDQPIHAEIQQLIKGLESNPKD